MVDRQRDLGRGPDGTAPAEATQHSHHYEALRVFRAYNESGTIIEGRLSVFKRVLDDVNKRGGIIREVIPDESEYILIVDAPKAPVTPTTEEA